MAYVSTGLMAMYPIYLARHTAESVSKEDYDTGVAQNEVNLNQNLEILSNKLTEIESYLASIPETTGGSNL